MIEHKIWAESPNEFIVGADEVGRGSIAGPIVAASVILNSAHLPLLDGVKDSKKISGSKRELIFDRINKTDIEIHYSSLSNKVIELKSIEDEIENAEKSVSQLKLKAKELSEVQIPKMMQEMNITKLKLKDGESV